MKFVPGAFQIKQGRIIKGGLLLGTFSAAVIGAILENNRGNDLYEKYLSSQDVEEIVALRKQTEKRFRRRNLFIAGASVVWLVHLLDLKLLKNKRGGVKGEVTKENIQIGFYYSF